MHRFHIYRYDPDPDADAKPRMQTEQQAHRMHSYKPLSSSRCYRFLVDSRDQASGERLDNLEDPYRLFRCRSILNCVDVCPKGLLPAAATIKIKDMMVRRSV